MCKLAFMKEEEPKETLQTPKANGHGSKWTKQEEEFLYNATKEGVCTTKIAHSLNRTTVAIISRQVRLGLREQRTSDLTTPLPSYNPIVSAATANSRKKRKRVKRTLKISKIEELLLKADYHWHEEHVRQDPIEALWEAIVQDTKNLNPNRDMLREKIIVLSRLEPNPTEDSLVTLASLGEEFGISRERIRQLFNKTKRKIFSAINIQEKNLGKVMLLISTVFNLHDKKDAEIVNWYLKTLARHRCSFEFTQGIIHVVLRIYRIKNVKTASLLEKYKKVAATLNSKAKISTEEVYSDGRKTSDADSFLLKVLQKSQMPTNFVRQVNNLSSFKPLRNVKDNREVYSANLQRYIQWESYGELRFIKAMENSSIIADFVEQPIRIQYGDDEKRAYVPDFLIRTTEGLAFVLEIKYKLQLADYNVLMKAQEASLYLGELGVSYCLVDHNGNSLSDIKKIEVQEEFKTFLRSRLKVKRRVDFQDLYDFFGGPPDDSAIDQIQSLVLNYPDKLRYVTNLEPLNYQTKKLKFNFRLMLI